MVPSFYSRRKDPRLVEAGIRGAFRRWGPPRVLRIDDFADSERAAIVSALAKLREARAAEAAAGIRRHE